MSMIFLAKGVCKLGVTQRDKDGNVVSSTQAQFTFDDTGSSIAVGEMDPETKEIREMTGEMMQSVCMTKALLDTADPGMGETMIDVLVEDLQNLRGPTLASVATKKAMLSQPMAGKTDEEIVATREKAIAALEAKGYTVINTLFSDEWYSQESMTKRGVAQIPLCFLAKSLENMSLCHAAYFCKGWENARGCGIEHAAAQAYGLEVIYEEDTTNE